MILQRKRLEILSNLKLTVIDVLHAKERLTAYLIHILVGAVSTVIPALLTALVDPKLLQIQGSGDMMSTLLTL